MGETVFIDTNIFLEIFLKDSKSEECSTFLKFLQEKNISAVTTDFAVYSSLIVIHSKRKDLTVMKKALMFFNSYSNLLVIRPTFDDIYEAMNFMKPNKLDFDDSLVVICMKKHNISKLISFDRHFDRVRGIKRVKP